MPHEHKKEQAETEIHGPVSYQIAKWYGYVFAAMYILWGGVKIILGVLDRNYEDFGTAMIFLAVGIVIVAIATAYKELKKWGWAGLVAVSVLVILLSLFNVGNSLNWVLIGLSIVSLGALFAPSTREFIEPGR